MIEVSHNPAGQAWDSFMGYDRQFYSATTFNNLPAYEMGSDCEYCGEPFGDSGGIQFSTHDSLSFPSADRSRVYHVSFSVDSNQSASYKTELAATQAAYERILASFNILGQ